MLIERTWVDPVETSSDVRLKLQSFVRAKQRRGRENVDWQPKSYVEREVTFDPTGGPLNRVACCFVARPYFSGACPAICTISREEAIGGGPFHPQVIPCLS